MADALDSGSSGSNPVRVQVPFSASFKKYGNPWFSRILLFFLSVISLLQVITVITNTNMWSAYLIWR